MAKYSEEDFCEDSLYSTQNELRYSCYIHDRWLSWADTEKAHQKGRPCSLINCIKYDHRAIKTKFLRVLIHMLSRDNKDQYCHYEQKNREVVGACLPSSTTKIICLVKHKYWLQSTKSCIFAGVLFLVGCPERNMLQIAVFQSVRWETCRNQVGSLVIVNYFKKWYSFLHEDGRRIIPNVNYRI